MRAGKEMKVFHTTIELFKRLWPSALCRDMAEGQLKSSQKFIFIKALFERFFLKSPK
jgi:hypothetical protein